MQLISAHISTHARVAFADMPPRRHHGMAVEMRTMLLKLDWMSRHHTWTRYKAWALQTASRRHDMEMVKAAMSSHDLLEGKGDCVDVAPNLVIPLPPPPSKYIQLKITDFFRKAPKKPKGGRQLKITAFLHRRIR